MPRIKFRKQLQRLFLVNIRKKLRMNWSKLAKILRVHPRSLSDWRREKYTLPKKVFDECVKLTKNKIKIPPHKVLPDLWSIEKAARKAGLIVAQKYGGPGTPEGRKKGGIISQQKRRLHPELYQHCNLRKDILKPRNTSELAEFFGIILGDGGINSDHQVVITLHKENDKKYIVFVCNLIKKLFGFSPAIYHYRSSKCKEVIGVTASSAALVEFLLSKGLKRGSKVRQQVGVPVWVKKNPEFSKSCLRGLIDTDGGVYDHRHESHGCRCYNIGLAFSNRSIPLLNFTQQTLQAFNFTPKYHGHCIYLFQEKEVCRYREKVGFNNPYHSKRLERFLMQKSQILRK